MQILKSKSLGQNLVAQKTVLQDSTNVATSELWNGEQKIAIPQRMTSGIIPPLVVEAESLTGLAEPQEATFSHLPTAEITSACHHSFLLHY